MRFEESRARARRRRGRSVLVSVSLATLFASGWAAIGSSAGRRMLAREGASRRSAVSPLRTGWPEFFADTVATGEASGSLEIRTSATGSPVDEIGESAPGSLRSVSGLAASDGRVFVVALPRATGCATRLYRVRVNGRGRAGALSRIGPTLAGMVWSLAASADGRVVGFAISGCAKGDPGYLGVLDVPSGRIQRWSDVNLGGVSFGNVALTGPLSMSADGRLLAFADDSIANRPYGDVTAQEVRVLGTDAPPGTVAARSKVILRRSGITPAFTTASITPSGNAFYLCLARIHRVGRSVPSGP